MVCLKLHVIESCQALVLSHSNDTTGKRQTTASVFFLRDNNHAVNSLPACNDLFDGAKRRSISTGINHPSEMRLKQETRKKGESYAQKVVQSTIAPFQQLVILTKITTTKMENTAPVLWLLFFMTRKLAATTLWVRTYAIAREPYRRSNPH
ncbi:hypothetical protein KY290_017632 [Solanum tuberosum]|uniref:Uncharacterized protein n=1 Tax=Solanum tuberosum TaxID=4113 RepID=A0ABQ7VDB3_SOLTU|nr:hypothetical protein KY290_017632 [Solanum tuberosum]